MKSVLLIGLGKFGQTLGDALLKMDIEVLAVDKNEDLVNTLAPRFTDAIITNCMNEDNLKALDVPSFDACVVAIGDDFQSSLEVTSRLKDLGAKWVVSKATTEIQRKFLLRNGADEVVYPDIDIAEKLAVKLTSKKVLDYIELNDEYAIFEIVIPKSWIGKNSTEIRPREKYGINVLTVKKGDSILPDVSPTYRFENGDNVHVFGKSKNILKYTK